MRGTDFRTTKTLHLLLAFDFPNERVEEQALGRVGRNGDLCTRSQLKKAKVSKMSISEHHGNLFKAEKELELRKKEEAKAKKDAKAQAKQAKKTQEMPSEAQAETEKVKNKMEEVD